MKESESSSGSNTAAMSPNAQPDKRPENSTAPTASSQKPLGEAEFLTREAANAQAAMGAAWKELTGTLKNTANITEWAKQYPFIATGVAAVAGFAASYAFIPASKDEAREKWEHLKAAVAGSKDADVQTVEVDGRRFILHPETVESPKPAAAQGTLATLLGHAVNAVKPLLMSLLASKFGGGATGSSQDGQPKEGSATNGHDSSQAR